MNKEDGVLKLKDVGFDFLLKQKIADLFDAGISHNIQGDLRKSFEAFKGLLLVLIGYDHPDMGSLLELKEVLTQYFDELGSAVPKRQDLIVLKSQMKGELRVLLDRFMTDIVRVYTDLGLWLSTRVEFVNFDKQLSVENFNSDLSTLASKKKFLSGLGVKVLLDSFSPNMVHDCFARLELSKVVQHGVK